MKLQKADEHDFPAIQRFYWDVIADIHRNNRDHENLGWEKGVYPSDDLLRGSIRNAELYTLTEAGALNACVILNSACNEGYAGCPWSIDCEPDEVLIPHALAVAPSKQGTGVGRTVVEAILELAGTEHKRAVRLDVLSVYKAAERLYTRCGFHFAAEKELYYEDTGWTAYKLFERNL